MRIGILTSHPIQYQAPLFKLLAEKVDLQVYFAHSETPVGQASAGFGVEFEWDVDLLEGYSFKFLKNIAKNPNANSFQGCNTPEIKQIIANGDFDAFIVCGWYLRSYCQAISACRCYKVPLLVRGDSQLMTPRSLLKRYGKEVLYRWFLRRFDGFLCVGKRSKEYYLHYGVPEEKLFFSPHCIDNRWFQERAAVSGNMGLKDKFFPVLLFVGKFIELKQPQFLLESVNYLRTHGFNAYGIFVGAGPLEQDLRGRVNDMGLVQYIDFAGFKNQSELAEYYKNVDILLLPSAHETWGLVVNEAMACGLPAIVSDQAGCVPDLIDSGATGDLFDFADIESLIVTLERFIPKCRSEQVIQSVENKIKQYSVETAVAGIIEAVADLSRKKRTY